MLQTRFKLLRQTLGMIETGNLLFLKLLARDPARARLFPGIVFRDYMALAGEGDWVTKQIRDIVSVPEGTRITLEHLAGEGISTPVDELAYLALISAAVRPQTIFEIGTFRGRTALNFALNSPENCVVWTMDLPPAADKNLTTDSLSADKHLIHSARPGIDYQGKDVARKIRQLFANSLDFDFTQFENSIDIVFVDGAHHYQAVLSDTQNALKIVRPGGYIIWHDFANYGDYNDVTRAVLDSLPAKEIVQIANSQLAVYRIPS